MLTEAAQVQPREHAINRGLFKRPTIAGIEADAFVLLVLITVAAFLPVLVGKWLFLVVPLLVFGAGYVGMRLVYRIDPRFTRKLRSYFFWNSVFRARPSSVARAQRGRRASKSKRAGVRS